MTGVLLGVYYTVSLIVLLWRRSRPTFIIIIIIIIIIINVDGRLTAMVRLLHGRGFQTVVGNGEKLASSRY